MRHILSIIKKNWKRRKELCYYLFIRFPRLMVGKYIGHNVIYVHWGRGLNNFGDCLQPCILKYFGLTPIYVGSTVKSDMVLAGTLLQWIPEDYKGIIIGTGGDAKDYNFPNAEVLAVRGELTRNNFKGAHSIKYLGDPGLLMPLMYKDNKIRKYKLGIVPHFVDENEEFLRRWEEEFKSDVLIINVRRSPKKVINDILKCEHIVSSSLHGLIIADAYHIPNLRIVSRKTMPTKFYDYKFDDYYTSLGCDSECFEVTGEESLEELIRLTTIKPKERIDQMRADLSTLLEKTCMRFKK